MSAPTIDFEVLREQLGKRPNVYEAAEAAGRSYRPRRTREELEALNAPMALRMALDDVTLQRLDRTVLELRERGLTYPAISTVLDLYEGLDVNVEQVRDWLGRLGVPKNPNKAHCFDHVNGRRRLGVAA